MVGALIILVTEEAGYWNSDAEAAENWTLCALMIWGPIGMRAHECA